MLIHANKHKPAHRHTTSSLTSCRVLSFFYLLYKLVSGVKKLGINTRTANNVRTCVTVTEGGGVDASRLNIFARVEIFQLERLKSFTFPGASDVKLLLPRLCIDFVSNVVR